MDPMRAHGAPIRLVVNLSLMQTALRLRMAMRVLGARSISYSTPIDSGKWRLVLDVGAYDFTTFDGMTGVNDLSLELRDNGLSVAKVSFRIHDDVGGDGVADQTQLAIQINGNGSKNSAFSGKDSDMTATDNQIWDFVAIEFDFFIWKHSVRA
jgi:hypothetical protein